MWTQPFFIPSLLFIVLSAPLILQLVPPNRYYGVRTARTLQDRNLWYRANRAGGLLLFMSGLLYCAVAYLVPQTNPADLKIWSLHLLAFVLPPVLGLLWLARRR